MALSFRTGVAASGSSSSATVAVTSFSTGDLMLVAISATEVFSVTPPSGWTEVWDAANATPSVRSAFYYRIKDGTEGSTVTFTLGSSGRWATAATAIFTDAPPLSVTTATAATLTSDTGGNTTMSLGTVTPGASGYYGIAAVGYRCGSSGTQPTVTTVPTGWTQRGVSDSFAVSTTTPQIAAIFTKANIASGGETPTGGVYSLAGGESNGHLGLLIAETLAAGFVPRVAIL